MGHFDEKSKNLEEMEDLETLLEAPRIGELMCGAAWYTRDQWEQMRAVATDPDRLESSYEDWLDSYEESVSHLAAQGLTVERVAMEVEEFVDWCRQKGLRENTEARARYAAMKLHEQSEARLTPTLH